MTAYLAGKTKQDMVNERYANQTVDYALPLEWVQECQEQGLDVVPHFVWLYDAASFLGRPAPITSEGDRILKRLYQ